MSQFSDIVNDVYTITNRSDLVAETALAVRQATLAAHRSDYYKKDILESLLGVASASIFQIDIPSTFPNFRAFAYIRPYDTVAQSPSSIVIARDQFLKPDAILDEYLIEKTNVAYIAGDNLNIKLEAAFTGLMYGYYRNPVVSPDANYNSWIARDHPAIITIDAARRVMDGIGWNDAAARLKNMLFGDGGSPQQPTGGEYLLLKQAELEDFGR